MTCSQHDTFIPDRKKERFPLRKETYSTLSKLFYQFYVNLELSERIEGLSKFAKKIADHYLNICFLFYVNYPIILLIFLKSVSILIREIEGKGLY